MRKYNKKKVTLKDNEFDKNIMIIILATMSQLIMKMRIVVLTKVTKIKRLLSKRKKLLKKERNKTTTKNK